jgi:hypothetical protein
MCIEPKREGAYFGRLFYLMDIISLKRRPFEIRDHLDLEEITRIVD